MQAVQIAPGSQEQTQGSQFYQPTQQHSPQYLEQTQQASPHNQAQNYHQYETQDQPQIQTQPYSQSQSQPQPQPQQTSQPSQGGSQNTNPMIPVERTARSEVLNSIRYGLKQVGSGSLNVLVSRLQRADRTGNGTIDCQELELVLLELTQGRVFRSDISSLCKTYSQPDGSVDYKTLIRHVAGGMNDRRLAIVRKAFDKIRNGRNWISMKGLLSQYRAGRHPLVVLGKMSVRDCSQQFALAFSGAGAQNGGKLYLEEFEAYYSTISANMDVDDDYFVYVTECVFDVKEKDVLSTRETKYMTSVMRVLKEKVRQRAASEGRDQVYLQRAFRRFDTFGRGSVTFLEFCDTLGTLGVILPEVDYRFLFDRYDVNQNGRLDYKDFIHLIYNFNDPYL